MKDPPYIGADLPIIYSKTKKWTILSNGLKYLITKRVDSNNNNDAANNAESKKENTLVNVSLFLIKKLIDFTCRGEVEIWKKLRNGTILIKTKNFAQANTLIQLCSLNHNIKTEVKGHNSLNLVRGVIYSNDSRGLSEEEILSELKNQKVYKIIKIMKINENTLIETGLIIVTFTSTNLPSDLQIRYSYIPLPLKWKYCLR